jgi:manganese efflux pump family protein
MVELLIFGVLAGLDNLQVSSALSMLPLRKRRVHLLAAAFCISEIGGALLGLLLGKALLSALAPVAGWLAPSAMLACGIAVLVLALNRDEPDAEALSTGEAPMAAQSMNARSNARSGADRGMTGFSNHGALLLGLPLSLSLDNVIAGAAISFAGYPVLAAALIVGSVSAGMACAGLYAGQRLRRFLPERIEVVVGAYLCVLALRAFFMGDI